MLPHFKISGDSTGRGVTWCIWKVTYKHEKEDIYIYILVYEIAIIIEYQRCIYHIEFHVAFCNSVCVRDPAVGLSNWLYSDSSK